jgi:15-cis-phytoene synthase
MQDAFIHCEKLVRAGDRDRFLSALFAPSAHRPAIFSLYAFNLEIARIREAARGPLAGEIRLQWWHDVLLGEERGSEAAGHPVATALLATAAKYPLDRRYLTALVEARRFDLYDEPMQTMSALEMYADAATGNLIALCAQILEAGSNTGLGMLAHHAGVAQALAGLLNAISIHARRGQLYVPLEVLERHGAGRQDLVDGRSMVLNPASDGLRAALGELRLIVRRHLGQAHELMRAAPAALVPAVLPVAVVPALLARMERRSYDPFTPIEIVPWRRQWCIWRAARRPDRIFR